MLQYNKKPLFCKQRLIFFLIGFWQKPHHHKLRTVAEPDIDGMSAEAAPHDHVLSVLFKLAGTIRMEKLVLRSHNTAHKRKTDGSAMEMAGQGQICPPVRVLFKIKRRVGKEDLKPAVIRRTKVAFQILCGHACRNEIPVTARIEIQSADADLFAQIDRPV